MRTASLRSGLKILVVEDDLVCARMLTTTLRQRGYAVVTAVDGVQAMRAARVERPDLIMLDIGLPGGDGIVTLARLRNLAETATTPVIISTSRVDAAVEKKVRQLGADGFLPKPVEAEVLLDTVARLTGGR